MYQRKMGKKLPLQTRNKSTPQRRKTWQVDMRVSVSDLLIFFIFQIFRMRPRNIWSPTLIDLHLWLLLLPAMLPGIIGELERRLKSHRLTSVFSTSWLYTAWFVLIRLSFVANENQTTVITWKPSAPVSKSSSVAASCTLQVFKV